MDGLHELEILWILFLQSVSSWLAEPMRLVSMLGGEEFFMLVMPSLYWCFNAALGFRVAVILILSNGLNAMLKLSLHSPRPYWFDERIQGYVAEHSFGIPSAHAQNAAAIWGLVAAARQKAWEKAALIGLIFLIGFSRIALGAHFITDVLFGWFIGGLLLFLFLKLERPIWRWLRERTLAQMWYLAIATTILLGLAVILPAAVLGAWQAPPAWVTNALADQPEGTVNPLNLDVAFTLSGTWFGLMVGAAWLYHRQGGFDAAGTPGQRLLRYVIGVAGIMLLWFGLGQVFPRSADLLSYTLRFFRYTLVGLWISVLAPLLFERIGLARLCKKEVASFSTGENPL